MKNVVFVMNNLGDGGAERVGITIAKYMSRMGHIVSIAKLFSSYNDYSVEGLDEVYTLPTAKNKYLKHLKRLVAFSSFCKRKAVDTVIVMGVGDMMIYYFHKLHPNIKLILSERNDPGSQYSVDKVLGVRVNGFLNEADHVVFQTEDAKNYFCTEVQKKGVIIPNPIKNDLPEPYSGIRRKEVVNFCRLNEQKNLPLLFRAFEKVHYEHPEYKLVVYGRGELKESLIDLINRNHQDSYISIYNFAKNIHHRILDAAMFVSSSNYEGISNSMLEAMAIGLPVVCTDCPAGGARMMIQHGVNGLLVPLGDENALATAMKMVISDQELSNRISYESRKIREKLVEEKICRQWLELL